ncbi:MAG: glycosyltransferase family 87 protein [Planctomycetota bacterium]
MSTDNGFDYAALYIAGKILHEHQPDQLYDMKLQFDLFHALRPYLPDNEALPFSYPPFFALLFWPLAQLPYAFSYLIWLSITASLYLLGLILIFRSMRTIPRWNFLTILLLAFSFEPFIVEVWLGGQTSSFGFLGMALSFYFYKRHKYLLSGLGLGICLYKPTLLIIILPFLLINRQGRVLLGFTLCGFVLTLISIFVFGLDTCMSWFEAASFFVRASTGQEILGTYKYLDVTACCRLLFGDLNQTIQILLVIIYVAWFVFFLSFSKKFVINKACSRELVLASIITWTIVLNIYFPMYDSIIVIIALLLTIDACYGHFNNAEKTFNPHLKAFLILIYLVPWITQLCAKYTGIQPYTLILISLGIYQLYMLREISRQHCCSEGDLNWL